MYDLYLVLYDIADKKRLTKASNIVLDYGIRIQESLYEVYLSDKTLNILKQRLKNVINPEEDGVKIIPLCKLCIPRRVHVGRSVHHLESPRPWCII